MKQRNRADVYDRLYVLADKLLKRTNACATCPVGCHGKDVMPSKIGCCFGCPHSGPQGCTVESLACKLWLCSRELGGLRSLMRPGLLERKLDRLRRIAEHYNIYVARASKEESLANGYDPDPWAFNTRRKRYEK